MGFVKCWVVLVCLKLLRGSRSTVNRPSTQFRLRTSSFMGKSPSDGRLFTVTCDHFIIFTKEPECLVGGNWISHLVFLSPR